MSQEKNYNIIQNQKDEAEKSVEIRYYSTLIAQQMAHGYRERTRKNSKAPPIFYVSPIKYELESQFYGVTKLYAETEIDFPHWKWKKYTNNATFIEENSEVYGAFTHLTYEWSNFQLMVTDLQGKGGIFSDPAINTNSEGFDRDLKDKTNHGRQGITRILNSQHSQCNELCMHLNLTRKDLPGATTTRSRSQNKTIKTDQSSLVSNQNNLTAVTTTVQQINYKQFLEVSEKDIISLSNIHQAEVNCVCDICGSIFEITIDQYTNQAEEIFLCDECLQQKNEAVCDCCGGIFPYFLQELIKSGKHPSKCKECILNCNQIQKNRCFYCQKYCFNKKIKQILNGDLFLCEDAYNYLYSLKCKCCHSPYEHDSILTKKKYMEGSYICSNCQINEIPLG